LAQFGIRVLAGMVAGTIPQLLHPELNVKVLVFSIGLACGCGLVFGTLPAWRASQPDIDRVLKETERGSTSASRRRSQSFLVVSEYAFTLVLLVGAGLLLRSFIRSLILSGLFAGGAVCLACLGIYGVVSYAIGQRARELCIRSALGARRQDIMRLVLIGGMKPSLIGIGVGLAAAFALARLVESQLFEVKAHDPLVFLASVGLLGMVAAMSVYLPARRAANTDPMRVLRHE
jgi:ABC-type antimicrobial peptide transport system permease subunit